MTEEVGEAVVRIRQDESGFDPAAAGKKAGKGYASGFGVSIKGLAGSVAGVLAVGKGIDLLKSSVGEARESQKVAAQTAQTIKATGSAAGVTADQVGDLAGSLSSVTGIDDEAIQSGANMLLTFKNVKNYVDGEFVGTFDAANKAALDLSAAGFGSIQSASVMMGKALNDPVKGMSALSRAGVTFSETQKATVKSLIEGGDKNAVMAMGLVKNGEEWSDALKANKGDIMATVDALTSHLTPAQKKQFEYLAEGNHMTEAQSLLLKEVKGQVGGVAEATATAGEKASVAWGNVQETLGTALLPALDAVSNAFTETVAPALTAGIEAIPGAVGAAKSYLSDLWNDPALAGIKDQVGGALAGALPAVQEALGSLGSTLLPVLQQVGSAVATNLLPVLSSAADVIFGTVVPALTSLGGYLMTNLVPVIVALAGYFTNTLLPTFAAVAQFVWTTIVPAVIGIVTTVAQNLKPVLDTLIEVFLTRVLPTLQRVGAQIRDELIPALTPLVQKVLSVTGFLLKLASAVLGAVLPPLLRFAGFLIANLVPAVVKIITFVVRFVDAVIGMGIGLAKGIAAVLGFANTIREKVVGAVGDVVGAVLSLPGKIIDLGPKMLTAGKRLIGAFVNGLKNAGGFISGIAGNIWGAVKGLLNGAIDRLNAALEFKISLPGPDVTINTPDIPHLARGTSSFAGGWAVVGEEGRELVRMPRGAEVIPHGRTEDLLSAAGGAGVYIGTMMPHNYSEFERQIHERQRLAAMGGPRPLAGVGGGR